MHKYWYTAAASSYVPHTKALPLKGAKLGWQREQRAGFTGKIGPSVTDTGRCLPILCSVHGRAVTDTFNTMLLTFTPGTAPMLLTAPD